ncbi:hypothetical protein FIV42_16695 [Persicimonas caeni]|uniref:Protein kinase domain-containing protein n=1 Tax=Persicimonas caeni TaxID=2292766 RepID=A0A4Y6PVF2_PERCE|nr:serine/threonine-protein kinase [Persicimonas caeni]QDG52316.1 hypothetical protein FIV42_16695 [Persicimonas caeni]QED33538.1 protein kinase [Persicimonas caeni]
MHRLATDDDQVGRVWADRFEIRRRLGAGGLGVVYEAFDQDRQERVAVKTLLHLSPSGLYSFKREFRTLAEIQHPNLVRLGELIHDGERWFFSMELLEGQDFITYVHGGHPPANFRSLPRGRGRESFPRFEPDSDTLPIDRPASQPETHEVDLERLRAALGQLTGGLLALHRAELVHRDIKPSNLMVTRDGRVVILDFGLVAQLYDKLLPSNSQHDVVGTVPYLSPEQGRGRRVGPATDWYSVGVLLYQIFTGFYPFEGKPLAVLLQKVSEPAPDVRLLAPHMPEDLASLCMDLLETEPQARPTGEDVAARLGIASADIESVVTSAAALGPRPPSVEFVGRHAELDALADALADTGPRQSASVFVSGAAGVGKSSLVHRFLFSQASDDTLIFTGRCYERESVPYNGFDGIIDGLSHFLKGLDEGEVADLLPIDAALLGRVFPVLLRVPAIPEFRGMTTREESSELRARAFDALVRLLANVRRDYAMILFVDDLQWADRETLELLERVSHPERGAGALLVATLRREDDGSYGAYGPQGLETLCEYAPDVRLIELDNLPERDTRDLLARLWPQQQDLDTDAIERLVDDTRGHPLLLRELVRHLSAKDSRGATDSGEPIEPAEPDVNLATILWRRVERLGELERELIELVCVSGIPVNLDLLAVALDEGIGAMLGAAERLETTRLVRMEKRRRHRRVVAYHDRIRESVVDHLSDEQRSAHHARLARAYQAEPNLLEDPMVLVGHLEHAGRAELAAQYAVEAAEQAERAFAFERAARLYRRALEAEDVGADDRLRLQIQLAEMVLNSGHSIDAAHEFQVAAELCTDAPRRRALRRRAAEALLINGDVGGGLEQFESVLADTGLSISTSTVGLVVSTLWHNLRLKWRGLGFVPRDPDKIEPSQLERLELLSSMSRQISFIDPVFGFNYRVRALLLALSLGHRPAIVEGIALQAVAYAARGGESAEARCEELLETATQIATTDAEMGVIMGCRASVMIFMGYFADGLDVLEEAMTQLAAHATGSQRVAGSNRLKVWRLKTLLELGRVAELYEAYDAFIDQARRQGDHLRLMSATRIAGVRWLLAGEPARVEGALEATPLYAPLITHSILHWYDLRIRGELALYRDSVIDDWEALERQHKVVSRSPFARRFGLARIEVRWWWGRLLLALVEQRRADAGHHKQLDKVIKKLRRESASSLSEMLADMLEAGRHACAGRHSAAVDTLARVIEQAEVRGQMLYVAVARYRRDMLDHGRPGEDATAYFAAEGIAEPDRVAQIFLPGFNRSVEQLAP